MEQKETVMIMNYIPVFPKKKRFPEVASKGHREVAVHFGTLAAARYLIQKLLKTFLLLSLKISPEIWNIKQVDFFSLYPSIDADFSTVATFFFKQFKPHVLEVFTRESRFIKG